METKELAAAIEAILFAAGYPIEIIKLMETLGCEKDQFEDAIGYGGYPITTHDSGGSFDTHGDYYRPDPKPYGIPYRSIYSVNVPNLFMCGRCCSMSHRALGSMRVQSTCAVTGQAAGLAAAKGMGVSLDPTMAIALTASASAPVAAMDTMFASKYGRDVDVSVGLVAVTTILSILTMPILVGVAMWIFRAP